MAFFTATKYYKDYKVTSGTEMLNSPHRNIVGLSSRPEALKWDDKFFYDNYVSTLTRYKRPVYDEASNAAKYFLNFYIHGDCEIETLLTAVTQLFYYMTVKGKHVVDTDHLIGEDTWTAIPRSAQIQEVPGTSIFLDQKPQEDNISVSRIFRLLKGQSITLNWENIIGWYHRMFDALNGDDQTEGKKVINYLGFLAGIMCRLCVKDPDAVSAHIVATTVDHYFSLFGTNLGFNFTPPPNSRSCSTWTQNLRKMSPGCNRLLTILITSKVYTPQASKTDVEGLLRAMCLLSLSYVGLGSLNWANKAAEATHMDFSEFISRMCLGIYRNTAYDRIYRNLVFVSDNNQHTFMYA